MTELLMELQRLDPAEVDDRLDVARRKMKKNTTLLSHKIKAAEGTKPLTADLVVTAEVGVVLARMQAVLTSSERTADEAIEALEQEVVSQRRGQ